MLEDYRLSLYDVEPAEIVREICGNITALTVITDFATI
jgi:hypothetical protein